MSEESTPEQLLAAARKDGAFQNAALVVRRDGRNLVKISEGANADALYDVASLTKVLTAALALGLRGPDRKVSWLDGKPTVGDLLTHRSGLPAWRPLFAHVARRLDLPITDLINDDSLRPTVRQEVRALVAETKASAPKPTYSDIGFLALGFDVEENGGESLPDLAASYFFEPLELEKTRWGGKMPEAIPTGTGRPRAGNPDVEPELLEGLANPEAEDDAVDDDNAAILGGRCGHAGLWSTAEEIARLGEHLRLVAAGAPSALLTPQRAQLLFTKEPDGSRTFGLDTPSAEDSSLGSVLGKGELGAAGHLGFTGCSLWIDRDAQVSIALLTDAVSVQRPNPTLAKWRPLIHDAVARSI